MSPRKFFPVEAEVIPMVSLIFGNFDMITFSVLVFNGRELHNFAKKSKHPKMLVKIEKVNVFKYSLRQIIIYA